jgi:hypothetical protein
MSDNIQSIKELAVKTLNCMQNGDLQCVDLTIKSIGSQRDYFSFIDTLVAEAKEIPELSFKDTSDDRYDSLSIPAENGITIQLDSGFSKYPDDDQFTIVDHRAKTSSQEGNEEEPTSATPQAEGFKSIVDKHLQQIEDATK